MAGPTHIMRNVESREVRVSTADQSAKFVRTVHRITHDLKHPRPAIYWTDFLSTIAVGYTALGYYLAADRWGWLPCVSLFVAVMALYRATIFTHELSHLHARAFVPFRIAWNLLYGIPFMMPSFLYTDHKSHHVNHSYGTAADAEYYPLGIRPPWAIVAYLAQIFTLPVLAPIRFVLITPISYLHPALRRLVWQWASSLATINPRYRRPEPTSRERWIVATEELGCLSILALIAMGVLPWTILLKLYVLFFLVTAVNYLRALGAHRYRSPGQKMTYVEQLLDSVTIPGKPLITELWAPLGMRFHALHHIAPLLPYRAMGVAHRRLMRELPADSPYMATVFPSLASVLWQLVRDARSSGHQAAQH